MLLGLGFLIDMAHLGFECRFSDSAFKIGFGVMCFDFGMPTSRFDVAHGRVRKDIVARNTNLTTTLMLAVPPINYIKQSRAQNRDSFQVRDPGAWGSSVPKANALR